MRHSLFLKLFRSYLIILVALIVFLTAFSASLIKSFHLRSLTRDLKNLCLSIKPHAVPLVARGDRKALTGLVGTLAQETGTRITVITRQGEVLADSEENPASMTDHWNRPEVIEALAGRVGTAVRYSKTVKQDMFYVAVPVPAESAPHFVIRTSMYLTDVNAFVSAVRKKVMATGAVSIAVALLYAVAISRRLSRPIREMLNATSKVADGDFSTRVYTRATGELGELAEHFNDMTTKLTELFQENVRRKEQLESLIASMQDGLVLFTSDGKISMFNDSFRRLARTDKLTGRSYWEIGNLHLGEFVKNVLAQGANLAREIPFADKTFWVSATRLPGTGDYLVLCHDISSIRETEAIKRDLVANVSHELRTPLTAIKGFLETMQEEEDPDKQAHYRHIIEKHVDRLINLVRDLLVLSHLEADEVQMERDEVDISALVERVLNLFRAKTDEKGLALSFERPEESLTVIGDAFKLEQLFFNLLDNAVKYTESGSIRLSLEGTDSMALFRITDSGIGIPKEHIPRIFERFYVVDKSRSRRLGGTGLGLSIVKHIVRLHGGTVQVDSTIGIGTSFIVSIPALTKI